jgi:hypothetical protein
MTAAELRTLADDPLFVIGGHTASVSLLSLRGIAIRAFSYPFGGRGQVTPQIFMNAGFECAVTAKHRRMRSGDSRFELPRRQAVNQNARTY